MDRVLLALQQIISNVVEQQNDDGVGPLQDIKAVYYGDPRQIPESNLPAIAIQPMDTQYTMRGSRYDQKVLGVEIRVVINKKDFYSDTGTPNETVLAVQSMVKRIEEQNMGQEVVGQSICGLIQKNTCLPYTDDDGNEQRTAVLSKVTNVQYKFTEERGFPTYEGVVQLEITTIGDR